MTCINELILVFVNRSGLDPMQWFDALDVTQVNKLSISFINLWEPVFVQVAVKVEEKELLVVMVMLHVPLQLIELQLQVVWSVSTGSTEKEGIICDLLFNKC